MIRKILTFMDKALAAFEEWSLFLVTFVAMLALFVNVVLRYGFNYSLAWSEELVRMVIIYTTLIGCSVAVRNRSMIKVDAMVQLVPISKNVLFFFSSLVSLIFAVLIVYYGWLMMLMQIRTGQKSIIMQIPLAWLYALLPLMGFLMFVRTLQIMYQDYREIVNGRSRDSLSLKG